MADERRQVPREELAATPMMFRVGSETFEARARNISGGGVYFETPYLFDPAEELRMAIDVPGKGTVSAYGRTTRFVARNRSYKVGVAVQFLKDGGR